MAGVEAGAEWVAALQVCSAVCLLRVETGSCSGPMPRLRGRLAGLLAARRSTWRTAGRGARMSSRPPGGSLERGDYMKTIHLGPGSRIEYWHCQAIHFGIHRCPSWPCGMEVCGPNAHCDEEIGTCVCDAGAEGDPQERCFPRIARLTTCS